jgi:hypothetical protein
MAVVACESGVCLGAGEVGERGYVGVGERLGDGGGEPGRWVAGGEDGEADIQLGDEGQEGAVGA